MAWIGDTGQQQSIWMPTYDPSDVDRCAKAKAPIEGKEALSVC